jgi:hypothetical protein
MDARLNCLDRHRDVLNLRGCCACLSYGELLSNVINEADDAGSDEATEDVNYILYFGDWIDDIPAFETSDYADFVSGFSTEPGYSSLSTAKREFRVLKLYPGEGTTPLTASLQP